MAEKDNQQGGQTGGNNQGSKKDNYSVQETKTRDFERINTTSSSTIKKGNDSQPLTSKDKKD